MNRRILSFSLVMAIFLSACNFTQKIRDGKTAFERKQYAVATPMLRKEFSKSKSRVEKGKIAFLLAESYKALNQSDNAIDWYKVAYDNNFGVDALKEHAYTLKQAERYDEALIAFKELGFEIGSPYEYRREVSACETAALWIKEKNPEYILELMDFNSGGADYSPFFYKDKQLTFSSDRIASTGDDTYKWTGNEFSDIFQVDLETKMVFNFDKVINTPENEGTLVFNKDFTEVYFTRCSGAKKEDAYCAIMHSKLTRNSWSVPEKLELFEGNINYGHPCLSADGNKLYFSCDHPEGWGGYDIYVSQKTQEGWGEPKLLSRSINTPGNEKFPSIDSDTLYFSSDYHIGMGGLDIFKSYQFSNGNWSPAYNLKAPINSGSDEFGYVVDYSVDPNGDFLQAGFLTSARPEGMGNDDIYRFEKRIPPPLPDEVETPPEDITYSMKLDGYVLEKIYTDPGNPNSKVLGRKPLDAARVEMQIGKNKKTVIVEDDGFFSLDLSEDTDYNFLASKENYLNNQAAFSTVGIGKDPANPDMRFEVEIVLDKIFKDKEIRLENIYYDFDKWFIRDDAKPTLDKLAESLNLNPGINIQLGSHTDCRGNPRYNEDLSQRRAQAAIEYLIEKGIPPERLVAKGFGENEPEVDCICARCTEEEHQENRRTTFKIIE